MKILEPVLGTDDGQTTVEAARYFGVIVALTSAVISSRIARRRQSEGKEQLFGVLF